MIMPDSEKVCPVCKTKNELEASFCEHCGARLDDPFMDSGAKTTDLLALTPERIRNRSFREAKEAVVPGSGIAFYVEGQSNPVYIDSKGEFILGRKPGTTAEMLLDLAPFGGYGLGLSRRHAVIRRTGNGYEVLDLGSVNGTWLNEQKLVPHKSYPLRSGSHLRLGRMRLLVLYRSSAETQ
jgi:hypothetical protein